MFHFDGGLKITSIDLAVDFRRRQARGFISHAHTDHMGRHELAYCTPATSALYQHRYGARPTRLMPFGEALGWGELSLTTLPAGHVFGSAMLQICSERGTVLYTGDFKLRPSATAEPANPSRADVLIMESTYGQARYRLPPREESIARLVLTVEQLLNAGRTPVVQAYVLGKAQEITKILNTAGFRVVQHPLVFDISVIYQQYGCELGRFERAGDDVPADAVVVSPPRGQKASPLRGLRRAATIAVTGWAVDPVWRRRLGADYAIPLSDHADFDELLECIERVGPKVIYCTHGPAEFVEYLQKLGHHALPLDGCRVPALFA